MNYSHAFIAKIKGALRCGLKAKQLAHLTGVPIDTIKNWAKEETHTTVEPDPTVCENIRMLLAKEN